MIRDVVGSSQASAWARSVGYAGDVGPLFGALSSDRLSPVTTSAGRLFDGVAAMVLSIQRADFDGQPAMLLEAACDPSASGVYPLPLRRGAVIQLVWRPLVVRLLADMAAGTTPGVMAMRFHRALARAIVRVCRRWPKYPTVLGGGVFQNRMLVESIVNQWGPRSDLLGPPGIIPPGDGGLAAGQLAVALARESQGEPGPCV